MSLSERPVAPSEPEEDTSAGRPALTVLIPTHDRPALLLRAVLSALSDLPQAAEILVVDDASRIPATEVLAGLAAQDTRLRVMCNAGPRGAAGARNSGVDQARGGIILFLDDDDELLPGYAARVVEIAGTHPVDYGFSAVLRRDASGHEELVGRRFATGPVPAKAALRHKIAALSAGFWIQRVCYMAVGGLDPEQRVDEDTSLCCSLVAGGSLPWYEAEPGVRVHVMHTAADTPGAQLTQATHADVVLGCYLRTWRNHEQEFPPWSEARWFLGARYLRRAAKHGNRGRILRFVASARPRSMMPCFALYGAVKLLSGKLQRG